jgi:oligo-1,6-glucosidase
MKYFLTVIVTLFCLVGQSANPTKQLQKSNKPDRKWWKEAVVYQIYPRSFKDSNGDGIGDLKGITQKLDYIESLGVDAIWLNPIYSSPNDDNGYDISDYRNIMKDFGTMADFDALLKGMHQRGIKLVMDLVVNHSSDEHEWFKQARSSRTNPYRNYYHWWPAEKGKPTPRWSFFDVNSDAWKYDSISNSYYLHYFSSKQPDLNWENAKVRQEVKEIMKFWLDKGIDGFRMDAFQYVAKDTTWAELPEGYSKNINKYYGMRPGLHDYLQELNKEVMSKYDIMTVAEGAGSTLQDAHELVDPERYELNMAYHFEGMGYNNYPNGFSQVEFKKNYSRWDSAFAKNGWLSIYLANHDQPRMVSRLGNDSSKFRTVSSKLLTTFILSMRGTPYYYNGDELGMTNIKFEKIEDYQDVSTHNAYKGLIERGGDVKKFLKDQQFQARDNSRTPFQWNNSTNAGFSTGAPWLKTNPNFSTVNVEDENKDLNSTLNYFRKMIRLRKNNPVLVYGAYHLLAPNDTQVYAYTRKLEGETLLVLLNFSCTDAFFGVDHMYDSKNILINNYNELNISNKKITLKPYQAVIIRLNHH